MADDYLDARLTERRNPRSSTIDTASALEIVDLIGAEDATVPAAVGRAREEIALAVDLIERAFREKIVLVGVTLPPETTEETEASLDELSLLVDTAGLRASEDAIESIGVARAEASLKSADLVLWLGAPEECPERDRALIVQAKADLRPADPRYDLAVSAAIGFGLAELVAAILDRARRLLPAENEVALHRRHRDILGQVVEVLWEMDHTDDLLIDAELLRSARTLLDRITGHAGVEDVLDALFARFCIGK